jgi:HPt (histidine-containing phosphotransfer) domain-containing protein
MTADLRDIMDVDPDMMSDLVVLFLDDSTARLETLSAACAGKQFRVIQAQAHSLKGSALQMGAVGLASLCARLELSDRPEPDVCELMMQAIGTEFVLVRGVMEEYLINREVAGLALGS